MIVWISAFEQSLDLGAVVGAIRDDRPGIARIASQRDLGGFAPCADGWDISCAATSTGNS
jgi:hypothetical protein